MRSYIELLEFSLDWLYIICLQFMPISSGAMARNECDGLPHSLNSDLSDVIVRLSL